ncbi:MAG: hypothetical protein IJ815_03285 [Lachnospiraceae bacterium]|nr:hypothetical protein [Lachnospiraceae bacterium]
MKPAIVVVAYNRADALKRVLGSLAAADYEEKDIPLVISIDKSDVAEVDKTAEDFVWEHGEKRIITHDVRMGLKAHVLECGDLTEEYGSIIMLEDDLFVSPYFYGFAKAALEFSDGNDDIGGISLYNHRFNVFARMPFEPIDDGFDNWFLQIASSWGQAWSKEQWKEFREWQKEHDGEDLHGNGMPSDAADWPESSWLKYAIKFLIETDRLFLYPRVSYTTNFFDAGEHSVKANTDLQVPLATGKHRDYIFSDISNSEAIYDAYFENELLPYESDIYGLKYRDDAIKMRYVLSVRSLPYHVEATYGLVLRPADANIKLKVPGNEIKLYELTRKGPNNKKDAGILEDYFYPGMNRKKMLELLKYKVWNR